MSLADLSPVRMTLAGHGGLTPVVGASTISLAADTHNGVELTFASPAGAAQLPHSGASVWMSPTILDIAGDVIFPYFPGINPPDFLVLERLKTGTDPLLVRIGVLLCNAPDPSSPACTEGFGFFMSYPSTTFRQVGFTRVTSAGVWAGVVEGTGRSDHFGVRGGCSPAGPNGVRNFVAVATDAFGRQANPNPANSASFTASVVNTTQARTLGIPITWYTGIWAGWQASGGTAGVKVRFRPMYWIRSRPGVG